MYIGETNRNLKTRIEEHKNNIRFSNQNSLLFQHSAESNHDINFNGSRVLTKSLRNKPRKFLESCFTNLNPNSYNRSAEIPSIYLPLIRDKLNK